MGKLFSRKVTMCRYPILIWLAVLLLGPGSVAQAGWPSFFKSRDDNMTGRFQEYRLNEIFVLNDRTKRVERYVYLHSLPVGLKRGDYVRVYYCVATRYATTVKKLKELEFHREGQNLGYMTGAPSR